MGWAKKPVQKKPVKIDVGTIESDPTQLAKSLEATIDTDIGVGSKSLVAQVEKKEDDTQSLSQSTTESSVATEMQK